jgi:PIN domain nuclease of toxin-antitoxin system
MIVLDTHVLVWWSAESSRLSRRAARDIGEADRVGVPTIAFWEVSLLVRKGKLALEMHVRDWARRILSIPRVQAIDLTPEIALLADSLAMHPDPADRFIVASAIVSDAPLVTKDRLLRPLRFVKTTW